MEVDQGPQGQGTPPNTAFDDGLTPSTIRGHTTVGPTGSTRTDNYFPLLYTESQETDHTNVNANHRPPIHEDTRNADLAAAAAAATTEAGDMEAEAAAANAAELIARLAAEAKAAAAAEAAAVEAASKVTGVQTCALPISLPLPQQLPSPRPWCPRGLVVAGWR